MNTVVRDSLDTEARECTLCGVFTSVTYKFTKGLLCKECKKENIVNAKTVEEDYFLSSEDTRGLKWIFDKYAELPGTEYQFSKKDIERIAKKKYGAKNLLKKQEKRRMKKKMQAQQERENMKARHNAMLLQHVQEGKLSLEVYLQVQLAQQRLQNNLC